MPLQLTTPIGVGDLDPGAPAAEYTHCKIRLDGNDPDEQIIPISISYGYYVEGSYIAGAVRPAELKRSYPIADAKWLKLVGTSEPKHTQTDPASSEYFKVDMAGTSIWIQKTYYASKDGLYEHLIAEKIIPPGKIV